MYQKNRLMFSVAALAALLILVTLLLTSMPLYAETGDYAAYWKFDEGSGTTTKNEVNGNNDLLCNGTDWACTAGGPTWVDGKFGKALSFSIVNKQWVKTNYLLNDGNALTEVTFSAWVKTDHIKNGASDALPIAYIPNSNPKFFLFGFGGTNGDWGCGRNQKAFLAIGKCGLCTEEISDIDTTWKHIVGVWKKNSSNTVQQAQFTMYVDGKESSDGFTCLQTADVSGGFAAQAYGTNDTGVAEIARVTRYGGNPGEFFDGNIDDVRIYERALSGSEVLELFAGGSAQISGPTSGVIGGRYQFSEDVISQSGLPNPTYKWEATGATKIFSPTEEKTDIVWAKNGTVIGTQYITVTITSGIDKLTDFHEINIQPTPAPTLAGATQGAVGSIYTYPFTASINADLNTPYTYTWELSNQPTDVRTNQMTQMDYYTFTSSISGTHYITLTVDNPWIGAIKTTHQIATSAVVPDQIATLLSGPRYASFGQSNRYTTTIRPLDITRQFTPTWQASGPLASTLPTPQPVSDWSNDVLDQQVDITWSEETPTTTKPVTRTVTAVISNAWGAITKTQVVTVTYRPDIPIKVGTGGFSKDPDNTATQISQNTTTGALDITIDEDTSTETIQFTIVDTDTLGMLNLSANPSNYSGQMSLPGGSITVGPVTSTDTFSLSTIIITPPDNRWGEADIRLDAGDGMVTGYGTIHLTVNQVNDPPSYTKGSDVTVDEDAGPQTIDDWAASVSAGPFEQSIQNVTFDLQTSNPDLFSVKPTITVSGTGETKTGVLAFTSAPDANGSAVVTATLKDDSGIASSDSFSHTFTITVQPVNDPPIAANDVVTTTENTAVTFAISTTLLPNDTDVDLVVKEIDTSQELSVINVTDAPSGTVTLNGDGTITYTPEPFFTGTDVFTYTLSDGKIVTPTARVQVIVLPTLARDDTLQTLEDTPLTNIGSTLLQNDREPATLSVASASTSSAQGGTVTLTGNSAASLAATDITYAPAQDFFGTDTFSYTITTGTVTDTATVTVTVDAVNDAPSFDKGADQAASAGSGKKSVANWATNILAGPTNEVTQTLAFTLTTNNDALFDSSGLPALDTNGTLSFTPVDSVTTDSQATVSILLQDNGGTANGGKDNVQDSFIISIGPNKAPIAPMLTYTTNQDTALTIANSDVLSQTTDPNQDVLSLAAVSQTTTQGGTVSQQADSFTYTPPTGFSGTDSFTYTVSDGRLQTEGTIQVTVVRTGNYELYLPLVIKSQPDLVVSFSIEPDQTSYTTSEPVVISVLVTNEGNAYADPFWVDFFFNPMQAPTKPNIRWDLVYADGLYYGLVWKVPDGLQPGASIVLTSAADQPNSYDQQYTRNWGGYFLNGTSDLYAFVDSWNDTEDTGKGAVEESDEENNSFHTQITVTASSSLAQVEQDRALEPPAPLPEREM